MVSERVKRLSGAIQIAAELAVATFAVPSHFSSHGLTAPSDTAILCWSFAALLAVYRSILSSLRAGAQEDNLPETCFHKLPRINSRSSAQALTSSTAQHDDSCYSVQRSAASHGPALAILQCKPQRLADEMSSVRRRAHQRECS